MVWRSGIRCALGLSCVLGAGCDSTPLHRDRGTVPPASSADRYTTPESFDVFVHAKGGAKPLARSESTAFGFRPLAPGGGSAAAGSGGTGGGGGEVPYVPLD